MLSRAQTDQLLRSPLFWDEEERGVPALPDSFLNSLTAETFAAGETVAPHGGEIAAGVLLSGTASAEGESGVALNRFSPGSLFGVAALFGGDGYVSTVKAETRCEAVFFTTGQLADLFRSRGDLALAYIRFLSGRIRFLNRKISQFTAPTSAEALYLWAVRNSTDGLATATRGWSALARTLGMGRASLYRAIDELEREGRAVREGDKGLRLLADSEPTNQ